MKKTVQKMSLSRETLRWLTGGRNLGAADGISVPSCIDGCPSAMCPMTPSPDTQG